MGDKRGLYHAPLTALVQYTNARSFVIPYASNTWPSHLANGHPRPSQQILEAPVLYLQYHYTTNSAKPIWWVCAVLIRCSAV